MSTSPLATPHTPSLRRSAESYGERALRKLWEEPFVPIGTFATVGAFTMAVIKLRRRESRSLNQWMRMRVAAQAFTIAAVCAYCWNPNKGTGVQTAEEIQVKRDQQFDKERREFHDRLKVAEAEWKETQSLAGDAKK
ncbi:hypoxia induced protein conserved region-domain-containing protein [Boletus edulis]|uniref:Hypoxia induced protein conserved region-domain-containing protein n=1 Tax=Boletus edulis BED1 TaxID=1328754 RepID=A0AAD4GMF7_BOLED|nr:hypoxia induced protein conserved region-domain-containing protein [Boletus edulis]KAF8418115.1 hypoxia induced protein conserved region-domain-containing protein [Boletus edulis BED1]KAF8452676.1 hypoxia induced protein conserved region-domain-containing protein [Boletus edulis BED1]